MSQIETGPAFKIILLKIHKKILIWSGFEASLLGDIKTVGNMNGAILKTRQENPNYVIRE
ncbi:MAG: hypothetical protein C0622_04705 [Desulfuromonas sp.]|nr:MAG: hypothetical protein C0622_04705 [Desulfuromonas sp.]